MYRPTCVRRRQCRKDLVRAHCPIFGFSMEPVEGRHVCGRMDGTNYPQTILKSMDLGTRRKWKTEHFDGSLVYGLGVSRIKLQPHHLPTLELARLCIQKCSHWLFAQVNPNPQHLVRLKDVHLDHSRNLS